MLQLMQPGNQAGRQGWRPNVMAEELAEFII
jgi:hypothetical protein